MYLLLKQVSSHHASLFCSETRKKAIIIHKFTFSQQLSKKGNIALAIEKNLGIALKIVFIAVLVQREKKAKQFLHASRRCVQSTCRLDEFTVNLFLSVFFMQKKEYSLFQNSNFLKVKFDSGYCTTRAVVCAKSIEPFRIKQLTDFLNSASSTKILIHLM